MDRELLGRVKRLIESYEQMIERLVLLETAAQMNDGLDDIEAELKAREVIDDLVDNRSGSMSDVCSVTALEIELREVSVALIDYELRGGVQ